MIAETQCVDQARCVFDLSIQPHDRGLAIGFNRSTAACHGQNAFCQHGAQDRPIGLYFRFQVLNISTCPGVAHNGCNGEQPPGCLGGLEPFDQCFFFKGHYFANFRRHFVYPIVYYLAVSGSGLNLTNDAFDVIGISIING